MELHTACIVCGLFYPLGSAFLPTFQDSERNLVSGHSGSCIQVNHHGIIWDLTDNLKPITHFRSSQGRPLVNLSISVMIADTVFSIVVEIIFLLQGKVFALLPIKILAAAANLLHQCLLHALYSFEYKWFSQGECRIQKRSRDWKSLFVRD